MITVTPDEAQKPSWEAFDWYREAGPIPTLVETRPRPRRNGHADTIDALTYQMAYEPRTATTAVLDYAPRQNPTRPETELREALSRSQQENLAYYSEIRRLKQQIYALEEKRKKWWKLW